MNKIKKLLSVGGDERQKYMAQRLSESGLYTYQTNELTDFTGFDGVILPLPVSSDKKYIKGTDILLRTFCENFDDGKVLFAGKISEDAGDILYSNGVTVYDYFKRPEFSRKNSVPTAHGVLQYVMQNSDRTINSLTVVTVGYGNCGRAICKAFKGLGAEVISVSRKYASLAEAESDGYKSILIKDIAKILPFADVVINTVPAVILKQQIIDSIKSDAVIIDIASYPYGFDINYAESTGRKVNILPSLPGRFFPVTAGNIIADTIINIIEEEGL